LVEKERELNENMASGEYQQVIELYNQLPLNDEGGRRASYSASYSYGQALLRTGREAEAAEVFQGLLIGLQELTQIEREFKLMQLIADIQFGMENYGKAFERYVDIINRYAGLGENIEWARKQQSVISVRNSQAIEVRNFSELMRSYLTYNADRDAFRVFLLATRFRDDFPESSVIPTVNHILFESRDRAEAWFVMVLRRVSVLKGEMKYQEALQVIDQVPMQEMPMDKMEILNSLADELISVSFEEEESKRLAIEEAMQEIWSTGQNYLRAKEYDQAIEVFSTLLDTIYAERANDKIEEAAQLAAQGDRRKAAELFVRAGKMKDQDNRTTLLLESRQLLKGILKKYPQSGLLEKAERNLYRIEQEIRSIDPALLTEPEVTADDQEIFQQLEETTVNGIPIGEWEDQVPSGFPHD
jgi:tetratricopeptide (TPR) repeat protein